MSVSVSLITQFRGNFEEAFITDSCQILWPKKSTGNLSSGSTPKTYFVKKSKVYLRVNKKTSPGPGNSQNVTIDSEGELTARFKNDEEFLADFAVIRFTTNSKIIDYKIRIISEAETNSKIFIKAILQKLNSPVEIENE